MGYDSSRNNWLGFQVITETGLPLGWVKSVTIDAENENHISLIVVLISLSWLPKILTGGYEIKDINLVCVAPNSLIVSEETENKLEHVSVGILERLGIIKSPARQQKQTYYISPTTASWIDGDDNGFQPRATPKRPNPKPSDDAAKIPLD